MSKDGNALSHETYRELLNDFVDKTLRERERLSVEAHLDRCAECRKLAEQLQEVDTLASSMGTIEPATRIWTNIESELDAAASPPSQPAVTSQSVFIPTVQAGWAAWAPRLVAASVLLFLGANLWILRTNDSETTVKDLRVNQIASDLRLAESHYESAISGLQVIFDQSSQTLDPALAVMLQENLELIENSISESRAALDTEPESRVAQDSLLEGLRLKVSLLQNIILLMNEVRKGNGEGAFGLIEGLNTP